MRMRMRIFMREGRSPKWKKINKEIRQMIREKKMEYVNKITAEGLKARNNGSFFRVVKDFSSKDKPKPWAVSMLYRDKSDAEIANEITDFFGAVSDLLPALDWDRKPEGCWDHPMDLLSDADIQNLIQKAKKPNSMVMGDVFPVLYLSLIHI